MSRMLTTICDTGTSWHSIMLGQLQVTSSISICYEPCTLADEYQASLYMLGVDCGQIEFCAPLVEGSYTISAVRDLKIVWR